MKVKAKISGLTCPKCAKSLQNGINLIDGVKNAKIDFEAGIITFDAKNADDAIKQIALKAKDFDALLFFEKE